METLIPDGPPWHCDDASVAEQAMQVVPPANCVPAARRAATPASSGRSPGRDQFLPRLDRFVIALTIITAMSVVVGTRAAMPSYSYDLVPAAVAAPTR